ncbi:SDR family NAD(P)-dependent oxidoreductase [Hyphomicrobium sp. 1Nfss2.1]|uniref:SDR family NAD(P)-dependent oxidoreductase n=1 Tax=Hyphomicrobium sp. 1Nfss2.1 TaxID=3413936 RepID=UPI003C7E8611
MRLIDRWLARYAEPQEAALEAIRGLKPVIVITGASRGIGLALARRFARAGHDVALIARSANALEAAAGLIASDYAVTAMAIPMDVTNAEAIDRITAQLGANGFYIEVLINNAAVGLAGPFAQQSPEAIGHLIDLNVAALTRMTRAVLPDMLARGHGGIINLASLGGLVPGPNQAAYYASKAYVVSLTRALAAENAGRGVRMLAVAPGPVDTGFHQAMGTELSFYRQVLVALSARQVAFESYLAFKLGWHLYVPGLTGKLLQIAVWIIPHALLLPLMGWLLRRRDEQPWHDTGNPSA